MIAVSSLTDFLGCNFCGQRGLEVRKSVINKMQQTKEALLMVPNVYNVIAASILDRGVVLLRARSLGLKLSESDRGHVKSAIRMLREIEIQHDRRKASKCEIRRNEIKELKVHNNPRESRRDCEPL